jgi:hypothetical protein
MFYFDKSQSGKKAHSPAWWVALVGKIPQIKSKTLSKMYSDNNQFKDLIEKLPKKCPFERQIWFKDKLIMFVPALCHLNPFYTQLMELKLKSLND